MEHLTTEELRTICWMCEKEAAHIAIDEIKKHKKPSENETRQRIISISKKAYAELIERDSNHGI